jgi:hypothetical protein
VNPTCPDGFSEISVKEKVSLRRIDRNIGRIPSNLFSFNLNLSHSLTRPVSHRLKPNSTQDRDLSLSATTIKRKYDHFLLRMDSLFQAWPFTISHANSNSHASSPAVTGTNQLQPALP